MKIGQNCLLNEWILADWLDANLHVMIQKSSKPFFSEIYFHGGGTKGQLDSEWIFEVIIPPKMPTKNLKDFSPTLW